MSTTNSNKTSTTNSNKTGTTSTPRHGSVPEGKSDLPSTLPDFPGPVDTPPPQSATFK